MAKREPRSRETLDELFHDCAIRNNEMESKAFLLRLATAIANDDAIEGDLSVTPEELGLITQKKWLPDHAHPPKVTTMLRMLDKASNPVYLRCCPCGNRTYSETCGPHDNQTVVICPKCHNGPFQLTHSGNVIPVSRMVDVTVRDNSYSTFGHFSELKETDDRIEYRSGFKQIRYHWSTDRFVHQYNLTTFIFNKKTKKMFRLHRVGGKCNINTPNKINDQFATAVLKYLGITRFPEWTDGDVMGAWIRLAIRYPDAMEKHTEDFKFHARRYLRVLRCNNLSDQRKTMDKLFLTKESQ